MNAPVIGFVGRRTVDKGLAELAAAWRVISSEFGDAHLVVIGWSDSRDGLAPEVEHYLDTGPRVHRINPVPGSEMPATYAAIDVVVLPTYREGFPYVPLEAAAMGLPVVATRVCGCVDAVIPNVTGLLVNPRSVTELAAALRAYLLDPSLRQQHGLAGRERVVALFAQAPLWGAMRSEYIRLMTASGCGERIAPGLNSREQPNQERALTGLEWSEPAFSGHRHHPLYAVLKRALDVCISGAGLALTLPAAALVWLAIRITMGRPVLYKQWRPGYLEEPFSVLKFRTMRSLTVSDNRPLPDSERLSPCGRFLRKASIDELPQLWNVLKGEMSLVGPRPLLAKYLPLYTPRQRRRHEVKPGITGWAQVNGRNTLTWEEKFELDVWYVENSTLWLDIKILVMTVACVFRSDGISQDGHATMPEFLGTDLRTRA